METVPTKFSYPEWVNESYFENIVRAEFENYQQILKFDVSPATSAGDNYSSIMLKVDIDIELTGIYRYHEVYVEIRNSLSLSYIWIRCIFIYLKG